MVFVALVVIFIIIVSLILIIIISCNSLFPFRKMKKEERDKYYINPTKNNYKKK